MTPAERKRRSRAGVEKRPTVATLAAIYNVSEANIYLGCRVLREGLPGWKAAIMRPREGATIAFAIEAIELGREAEQLLLDSVHRHGITFARRMMAFIAKH